MPRWELGLCNRLIPWKFIKQISGRAVTRNKQLVSHHSRGVLSSVQTGWGVKQPLAAWGYETKTALLYVCMSGQIHESDERQSRWWKLWVSLFLKCSLQFIYSLLWMCPERYAFVNSEKSVFKHTWQTDFHLSSTCSCRPPPICSAQWSGNEEW